MKTIQFAYVIAVIILMASTPAVYTVRAQAVDQPKYGGTFVVAMDGDPDTLNPSISTGTYDQQIGGLVFSNLLSYDENYTPHPDLAQSWDIAPDGLTYTFYLVHNATWHDGYPFTSADVKFTFTQVLPKYMSTMVKPLSYISSVETPDNYTVVFHLSKPYTPFFYLLSIPDEGGGILPVHLYNATDILTNPYNFKPIGTGPYKFAQWVQGQYIELVRNDNYFRPAHGPYLDQIIFKTIPDPTTRALALQSGDVNYLWFYTVPDSSVPQLKSNPNLVYIPRVGDAPDEVMMFMNERNPILNNTNVRHALAYATNKTELVEKITLGLAKEATGPIPSTYGPKIFDPNLPVYQYDVAKANQLLDAAGYARQANGTRFSLELTWIVTLGEMGNAAELLKSQWAKVGVNLKLAPRDRATLLDTVFNRWDYDLFIHSMGTDPLPDVGVARLYVTSNIGHNSFNNGEAYSNSTVDALWTDAATTVDPAKRTQDLYQIQGILVQDMPMLWLWEVSAFGIYSNDFGGVNSPNTNNGAYYFQEVYWTKGTAVSPSSATEAITSAQSQLNTLENQGSPSNLGVAGLAAVVIIVAAIAAVFFLRRRRAKVEEG
jgi:peptide/nickel transport system substrate-binding protein